VVRCLNKTHKHKKASDPPTTLSTDGIDMQDWTFPLSIDGGTKDVILTIWDFAGNISFNEIPIRGF
jgi:hypothetical protein